MKAYGQDLRQKIIESYNNKEGSYRNLAKRFHVSLSFVQTLLKRYLNTGSIEPLPHGGRNASKIKDEHLEILEKVVAENNDATLEELCVQMESKTQLKVSRAAMGRTLHSCPINPKKKPDMQPNKIRTLEQSLYEELLGQ